MDAYPSVSLNYSTNAVSRQLNFSNYNNVTKAFGFYPIGVLWMLRDHLLIRAFFAFILLPGIVALLLPPIIALSDPWATPFFLPGCIVIVIGLVLLLWCVRDFYVAGKGTLAPWDPPKNIVIIGLYHFVRNPMYGSIVFLVLGWGIFFHSPLIMLYDSLLFLAFHVWVVKFEEPRLKELFGKSWETYQKNVNRWLPRFTTKRKFSMTEAPRKLRNLLLICGILASLLYICTDMLSGMLWEGYNFLNQAVSELSAAGAQTRPIMVVLGLVYDVLLIAFGVGVWTSSRKRALRITGGLVVGIGVLGFVGIPFPLQLGAPEATSANIIHSLLAGIVVLFFLLAIGFGAFTSGKRFRLYSIITMLILIVVGAVSGVMSATRISQEGFITPPQWFGLIERIDIYLSMLWVVVLAATLIWSERRQSSMETNAANQG